MLRKSLVSKLFVLIIAVSMVMPQASILAYADEAEAEEANSGLAAAEQVEDDNTSGEKPAEASKDDADETSGEDAKAENANTKGIAAADQVEDEEVSTENVNSNSKKAVSIAEDEAPEAVGDALIGEKRYEKLQDAIDAAEDGDTISLAADFKESVTVDKKSVTIDLAGNTWTARGGSHKDLIFVNVGAAATVKNGTVKGGKNISTERATIVNDGTLNIENMKFTGNSGNLINSSSVLDIKDSEFKGNDITKDNGGSAQYLVRNYGDNAVATITDTVFKDNHRVNGGIIYANGSYYESRSKNAITLKGCDIVDNTIETYGSLYCYYYVALTLDDTTIKNNESTSTWDGSAGLYFKSGMITWKDSAVYDNKVPRGKYANDIYFYTAEEFNGEIPLPKDMSDHGKKLSDYRLVESSYNYVAEEPLSQTLIKNLSKYYRSWTVEKEDISDVDTTDAWKLNDKTYATIKDAATAVDSDDQTITLLRDAKAADEIAGRKGLTIDLGGHTLSGKTKGASTLTVSGSDITIKNGTIAGNDCNGTTNSAVSITTTNATLQDVTFKDNTGRAITLHHNYPLYDKDTNPAELLIKNCTFTDNCTDESTYNPYALLVTGYSGEITGCTFSGNKQDLRYMNNSYAENRLEFTVSDTIFTGSKTRAIDFTNAKSDKAYFKNCTIKDCAVDGKENAVISLGNCGYGSSIHGGDKSFENCTVTGNSGATYTLKTDIGNLFLTDCLFEGNSSEEAGAVYVGNYAALALKDTVIRNNVATGISSKCSGGIALFSAKVIVIDIMNSSQTNLGEFSSAFVMSGGAIYGNKTSMTSPTADDLYVAPNCNITVPAVAEFKDGDKDFSGLMWKDDAKADPELVPAATSRYARYYAAGTPGGLKQIYIDGVNGDDINEGTKTSPVKTIDKAKELAELNGCKTILVLNTVTVEKESELAGTSGMHITAETDNSQSSTIDLGGLILKRDPSMSKTPLIDVADGADVAIKDTTLDGNSKISVKAMAPLVMVEEGGELTLDDGATLQNNGIHTTYTNPKGGAIWTKGKVTMNNGSKIYHNYAITGGGICVDGGFLQMNGGVIDDNVALWRTGAASDYDQSFGGGVCVIFGGTMVMEDGEITNNSGLKDGGGISLGTYTTDTVTKGGVNRLYMHGGTIKGNKGYNNGGGIFVQCSTEARITGGTISDNEAAGGDSTFGGGGIYVNGYHSKDENSWGVKHGQLFMTNVEIANNEASWEGGAIGVCGSGEGNVSNIKGTVIYDNDSLGKGGSWHKKNVGENGVGFEGYNGDYDVFFDDVITEWDYSKSAWKRDEHGMFNKEATLRFESFLSESMLNGASYDWVDENGDAADIEKLHKMTAGVRLNTDATASDKDVQESIKLAKVHVTGNTSGTNGGGIGTNGYMYIGQLPEYKDIEVEKKWDDKGHEGERPDEIKVTLLRNNEKYSEKIIKADEDGNWKCTFQELLKYEIGEDGEPDTSRPYEYTVEEDVTYKKISEKYNVLAEKNEDGSFTITNSFKEVPDEPEEPKTPPEEPKTPNEPDEPEVITGEDGDDNETYRVEPEPDDDDEEVVKGSTEVNTTNNMTEPKTGDTENMVMWIMVAVFAILAALAARLKKNR